LSLHLKALSLKENNLGKEISTIGVENASIVSTS